MSLPVAILAGGLATRLHPITQKIPKALVDVAGKPFVVRQVEYLKLQGIKKVILCIGFLGEQIEEVVGDGTEYGVEVIYSHDGPQLLGTGGALRSALPYLGEAFFVYYGDSYLPINFAAVEKSFYASEKPALMTVLQNQNQWDTSNVVFQNKQLIEYNKRSPRAEMEYIDYGLGIMSAEVLSAKPLPHVFDLADIYHQLSIEGLLAGYEVFERFYEIGSHKGLQETIDFFIKDSE